jgi:hypothetical protein
MLLKELLVNLRLRRIQLLKQLQQKKRQLTIFRDL